MVTLSMSSAAWCKFYTLLSEGFYEKEEDKTNLSKVFQQILPIVQLDNTESKDVIIQIDFEDGLFQFLKSQWENPIKPHLFAAQDDQAAMRESIQNGFDSAQTVGVKPADYSEYDKVQNS